ncbi:hypothetical protein V2J09_016013 [Rumex salicifolius]
MANKKKCTFNQPSVEYLGHVLSEKGLAMDPSKVASVLIWPTPRFVKGVRGLIKYIRNRQNFDRVAKERADEETVSQRLNLHISSVRVDSTFAGGIPCHPDRGHSDAWRTYKCLSANVYWPGMFKVVRAFVVACLICQKSKYEALSPTGLLHHC